MAAPTMKRFMRLLLVAALLYGTGAHWAAVQGLAWGKMIAERAPARGLADAVSSTFDGKSPCGVCLIVDKGARPQPPARVATPSVHFIAVGRVAPAFVAISHPTPPPAPRRALARDSRPDSPPPKPVLLA